MTMNLPGIFRTLLSSLSLSAIVSAQTTILPNQDGGGPLPSGWVGENNVTTNDIDRGSYWLVDSGTPGDFIISENYDLSSFDELTINVDVATFGSGTAHPLLIEFSLDGGSNWEVPSFSTATPSGSSYVTGGPVVINAAFTANTKVRFSSAGSSGRGVRIRDLEILADTTAGDLTAPTLIGLSPADDSLDVPIDTQLTLTFDETVQAGTGTIVLYDGGGIVETFDVAADATFSGTEVTVTPASPLANLTSFYVLVGAGAITDSSSNANAYGGISDPTAWNFTTDNLGAAAPGDIVITEIMQNPSAVGDTEGEWFEIFNASASDINLDGWTINSGEFHVIDNGGPLVISSGSYMVLGVNSDTFTNGGVAVDYQYSSLFLGNSSDQLVLTTPASLEIDRVEWDDGATFPNPNGASMALASPASDNSVGANWITSSTPYGDGDLGTPGAANPAPNSLTLSVNNSTFSEADGFGASILTITRSDTSGDLEVTLFSSDPTEAKVALATVTIFDGDADEVVDIDAVNDLWPDGDQTVTISATAPGAIGDELELTVEDDSDTLSLVINEVYYAPDSSLLDANGDGITPTFDDEFVEIVNTTAAPIDLSFFSLVENGFDFNTRGPVHFFPEGTVLAPGAAIVVFSGGDIPDGSTAAFGTAEVQKASEGGLFLSDGGDNLRLRNDFEDEVYGVSLPDVNTLGASGSLTLSPDLNPAGGYIPHTTTTSATEFSPGTQTDGTPFATIGTSLSVVVNTPSVDEDAGVAAAAITVSLPAPAASDTIVRLESSDEGSLFIPDTATIVTGNSSVDVDVFPVDELIDDGDQSVTVTAALSGFLNGSGSLTVVNDDTTFTDIVINEVDADTTDIAGTGNADELEFIELFNKTGALQSLDGLVLVLFNGSDDASYEAIDLTGLSIPANGFLVIGNAAVPNVDVVVPDNTIQNGPDAVALISGDVADFANDTPVGSFTGTLIDAVVYGTDDNTDSALITALTPSGTQLDEGGFPTSQGVSNSRVPDGGSAFDTTVWAAQTPTPGATNVLPPSDNYNSWIAGFPGATNTGTEETNDGDGPNILDAFFGTDPTVTDNNALQQISSDGTSITFRHKLAKEALDDVVGSYEWSADLDTWNDDGGDNGAGTTVTFGAPAVVDGSNPDYDIVEVTATVSGTALPRVFVRINVDLLAIAF